MTDANVLLGLDSPGPGAMRYVDPAEPVPGYIKGLGHAQAGPAFLMLRTAIVSDEAYWTTLIETWQRTESPGRWAVEWNRAMTAPRHVSNEWLMSDADQALYRNLQRRRAYTHVYRGFVSDEAKYGIAWTLDYDQAKFFATRFQGIDSNAATLAAAIRWGVPFEEARKMLDAGTPRVIHARVDPAAILAVLTDRGEAEVLIPDSSLVVHHATTEEV